MLNKNAIAELLKTTPEALSAFEDSYRKNVLEQDKPGKHLFRNIIDAVNPNVEDRNVDPALINRIVDELVADTRVFKYKNGESSTPEMPALPDNQSVTLDELNKISKSIRPQLSRNCIQTDMEYGMTGPSVLFMYKKMLEATDPAEKKQFYGMFHNGLDVLDIDSISYKLLDTFEISMGYWLPRLIQANEGHRFFKIPDTTVAKLPISLLQLSRIDYGRINETTHAIVNKYAQKVFEPNPDKDYFVKTGVYSSKFDFRNAHVTGAGEVAEIGDYLLYIHADSVLKAGQMHTNGIATTTEWVVREFIHDVEDNPMIYRGLPLHTEYRVFIDCDADEVLSVYPYWEPETMKQRFGHEEDSDTPDMTHDYIVYKSHEETLMRRFHENKDLIKNKVQEILPDLDLTGHWSLDIMQNGDDFWLIDMATGPRSAFYDKAVPEDRRHEIPRELWTSLTADD